MAKWMEKVKKEREKEHSNYQKGKTLLMPIFKKYNFDFGTTRKINGINWGEKEKENFINGMKYIGYNEEFCGRIYNVYL